TSPNGITDTSGNFLDGNNSGTGGTNFSNTFARGTILSYVDGDGDKVNLKLQRGGFMEVLRSANGNAQLVRLRGTNRRSVLSGTVRRTNRGGNGQTNLGLTEARASGNTTPRLTSPPFFVNSQFGNFVPPVQINSVKKPGIRLGKHGR